MTAVLAVTIRWLVTLVARPCIQGCTRSRNSRQMITFQHDPGGSGDGYAHPGEEFVEILAGELTFWIDQREQYGLQAGDSLSFRGTRCHRWRNDGNMPTTVLWINLPVVEPAPA